MCVFSGEQNVLEAVSGGASASIGLVANIAANLIAFLAILAFINATLGWLGGMVGYPDVTFEVSITQSCVAFWCSRSFIYMQVYIYIYICVCVCVCVYYSSKKFSLVLVYSFLKHFQNSQRPDQSAVHEENNKSNITPPPKKMLLSITLTV